MRIIMQATNTRPIDSVQIVLDGSETFYALDRGTGKPFVSITGESSIILDTRDAKTRDELVAVLSSLEYEEGEDNE